MIVLTHIAFYDINMTTCVMITSSESATSESELETGSATNSDTDSVDSDDVLLKDMVNGQA